MNLSPVSERTAAEIRALVEVEAAKITDPNTVKGLRTFLIAPRRQLRTWDWQKPYAQYPVWVVAESSQFDYGIVFSDYGFAPEQPWGLVFSSKANFDADYCWYASLEQAFQESRLREEFDEKHPAS
jgi:hypothetical protein